MVFSISKKKKNAIIEFASISDGDTVEKETGLPEHKLKVKWLSGKPKEKKTDKPAEKRSYVSQNFDNFDDHEKYVLNLMREAGKKQKLDADSKKNDF